jgi:hypothetical protein
MGNRPSSPVRGAVSAEERDAAQPTRADHDFARRHGVERQCSSPPQCRALPNLARTGAAVLFVLEEHGTLKEKRNVAPAIELENRRIRAATFKVGGDEHRLGKGLGSLNGRGPDYRDMFPIQLVLHAASLVEAEQHVLRIDEQIEASEKVLAENAANLGIHPLDRSKIQYGDPGLTDFVGSDPQTFHSGESSGEAPPDRDDANRANAWKIKLFRQRRFEHREL